jgi:hypothetical protein
MILAQSCEKMKGNWNWRMDWLAQGEKAAVPPECGCGGGVGKK